MPNFVRKLISTAVLGIFIMSLNGCVVFPLEETDTQQSLYWCPPLHNCASTEASTFIHSIQPFELLMPIDQAWPLIRSAVADLPGTEIQHEYPGYIYAKSYTPVFKFLDFIEVLAIPEEARLNVRSSSLLGLSDLFKNYLRTEKLREALERKGIIKPNE